MDRYPEVKGFYFITDNAPIHSSNEVNQMVEDRKEDYERVYLLLYSSELNSIEQSWATVKHKLKRNQLMESETLAQRITGACNLVFFLSHLINITQH